MNPFLSVIVPLYNEELVSFSRNFGHQIAITAGMDRARGQVVAIIDADLQDPPEVILEMIEKWRAGGSVSSRARRIRPRKPPAGRNQISV